MGVALTVLALLGFSFAPQYWVLLVFALPYASCTRPIVRYAQRQSAPFAMIQPSTVCPTSAPHGGIVRAGTPGVSLQVILGFLAIGLPEALLGASWPGAITPKSGGTSIVPM